MELKDVIRLMDAGFSKDEVMQLVTDTVQASQKASVEPLPKAEEVITEEKNLQEPVLSDAPEEVSEIQKLQNEIAELKKQMIKHNINNNAVESQKQESDVDILAGIINPNYGRKN